MSRGLIRHNNSPPEKDRATIVCVGIRPGRIDQWVGSGGNVQRPQPPLLRQIQLTLPRNQLCRVYYVTPARARPTTLKVIKAATSARIASLMAFPLILKTRGKVPQRFFYEESKQVRLKIFFPHANAQHQLLCLYKHYIKRISESLHFSNIRLIQIKEIIQIDYYSGEARDDDLPRSASLSSCFESSRILAENSHASGCYRVCAAGSPSFSENFLLPHSAAPDARPEKPPADPIQRLIPAPLH